MASQTETAGKSSAPSSAPKRSMIIINSTELASFPEFLPLVDLLDRVFVHVHLHGCPGKELLPKEHLRFEAGPQQMIDELGPSGFCAIMFEEVDGNSEHKKIIASGSAKPYKPTKNGEILGSDTNMLFKRESGSTVKQHVESITSNTESSQRESQWELIAFATEIGLQGQGIAGQLTDFTVAEIRKRVNEEWTAEQRGLEEGAKAEKPRIVLILSTMREVNEGYYAKRGWTTTSVKTFAPGTGGSRDGFSIAEMIKPLD